MNNNELANKLGVSVNDVEKMVKTLAYRREYNSRPEVIERRKKYTRARNLKLSLLNKLLKGGE